MDSPEKFHLTPLPMEKEFRVLSVRRRLNELSREELEEFLSESLSLLTKMSHQLMQLKEHISKLEGITE